MKEEKHKYCNLCKTEPTIPIFSQYWWLDAVCGEDGWDVIFIEKERRIIASMPYFLQKKYFFKYISMPPLTQTMGPWIKYPNNIKYADRLEFEKTLFNQLIARLPRVDMFNQNFHYSFTNWLPFYWNYFEQTTRYTYIIEDISNLEETISRFSHAKHKNIKKAQNIVDVQFDLDPKTFYENHIITLKKQHKKISYSYELFKRIHDSSYQHNAGKTIYAVDKEHNIEAALFVIWDECSAYDLISTIDPDFRNSGASTLLVQEIIRFLSTKTQKFDFEGSMFEGVENSFRQFGTIQMPFFNIRKYNSKIAKAFKFFREIGR